jgi:hypothetical protein
MWGLSLRTRNKLSREFLETRVKPILGFGRIGAGIPCTKRVFLRCLTML